LSAKPKRPIRRVVIDTSVLVAGIAGFRGESAAGKNASATILRKWAEGESFVWLVSEEILDEYKEVLRRLGVRRHTIGRVINALRARAELAEATCQADYSPDPADDAICACAEAGSADFIVTLNPRDFPPERLSATVLAPEEFLNL
jgi:putative PIN family toxin of toxin-antitoxin system